MHLPVGLGRLLQHSSMKHRHVVMKPNGEPYECLGQAQYFRAQPRIGRVNQNQVHEQQQQVQDVAESLQYLQADVGGLRSSVEKLERFEAGDESREAEDGEVDGEVDLDEDQQLLEREVGFDAVEEERD